MRHAFGPIQGHFMGYGDGGATIFMILLVILAIVLIAALVARSRRKSHPEHARLLSLLKEKYARREISDDEYRERSMLLEDEYGLNADDPKMITLKERYARCEIDSREYAKRRKELQERADKFSSVSFKEGPAR